MTLFVKLNEQVCVDYSQCELRKDDSRLFQYSVIAKMSLCRVGQTFITLSHLLISAYFLS